MATTKVHDPIRNYPPTDDIIIERRIHIATIHQSPSGTESAIALAFQEVGKYMADNDEPQGFDIEFSAYGRTFGASLAPDEAWIANRANHQDDEY